MDKIDVEILWTLKQSSPHTLRIHDVVKKNKKLLLNDELKGKLHSLENDGIIESTNMADNDISYTITKKGNDLIWNGEPWNVIFNLIKLIDPEKYTSNDIRRITNKSLIESVKNIEYLRKSLKIIDGRPQGFKLYFALSEKGKSFDDKSDL
jgi:predicted transcriptional regulator